MTHKQMIKDAHRGRISVRDVDRTHVKEFGNWFEQHVSVKYNILFFNLNIVIVVRN